MKKLVVVAVLLVSLNSQAQKWRLRVSYNRLLSYRTLTVNSINSSGNNTFISKDIYVIDMKNRFLRQFVSDIPKQSGFGDVSLVYNVTKKKSILLGYRNIHPVLGSSVKVDIYTDFGKSTLGYSYGYRLDIPTLKLNYSYLLTNAENKKSPKINIYGGVLLHFKLGDGKFDSGRRGVTAQYYDSNGNKATYGYILIVDKEFKRPKNPMPYINLGVDFGQPLGKNFVLGTELAAYAGPKSLFIQKNYLETHESQASYEIKIKPYFFSGGVYLQYRLR